MNPNTSVAPSSVTCRRDGSLSIIEITNPPVNALAHSVRSALLDAVVAAEADTGTRAIVIATSGKHFVAGADIREFDAPPLAPLLNDVLLRIEACSKPVIAALHGSALGGGFELALACHYRVATPDTSVGLPEVKLGLLPGAGGTQRLPRLAGASVALDMMLRGEPISATRARDLGIVDRLLEKDDALGGAVTYAGELVAGGAGPRRLRDRTVDPASAPAGHFDGERARVAREMPHLVSPPRIIECVEASVTQPFEMALALSRTRFEECRESRVSRSLRHLFFAERPRSSATVDAKQIKQVAVVGAGTMGAGIAISLATAGFGVTLIEPKVEILAGGVARLKSTIEASAAKGRLSAAAAAAAIGRVRGADTHDAAAGADLVIEAVFENLGVKQSVFRDLAKICAPGTVLATNTSTLDVDAIASATPRPAEVVGMHFFSPANIMRLVEIVRGRDTAPPVIATALAVTRAMGKLGVVVGNCFGFAGNRMLYAYGSESQQMLLEGASPAEVDRALVDFGMAMGPNAVGDLAGLDVGYRVRRERTSRPDDPRYYRVFDVLAEAGRLGQKSGRGIFRYEQGSRVPLADPEVDTLIAAERARLGIRPRHLEPTEMAERCIYALINEGARVLEEGIAATAADLDAIWCNGYGFPRFRGGPMFHADLIGADAVLAGVRRFEKALGPLYWTPAPLLVRLGESGGTFADLGST